MFEFLTLKSEAFGLDFSDLSLKIVKLEKKRDGFKLICLKEVPFRSGIIRHGEIKKEEELVGIVKKAISEDKGKKIKTKYVIASLPEEKAFLEIFQMPRLSEEELKSAVILEAENHIPLPIEKVYFDFKIISSVKNHPDHCDILITALPKTVVDPYLSCIKKAGLNPLVFEMESFAIARTLIKDEVAKTPVLIIDFGAVRTSFIVFSGHSLRFTFSIPVSSQSFTEAISRTMKIDLNKAEKIKTKYGLEDRTTKEGSEVFNALVPSITDLIEQIKKCLNYYQTHASNGSSPKNKEEIEKVLICGGGARLKGLTVFLSQQIGLPVEFGNPWTNIPFCDKKKMPGLSAEESLKYTTALGLALRGLEDKKHD